jgi:hypothetical protein
MGATAFEIVQKVVFDDPAPVGFSEMSAVSRLKLVR